MMLAVKQNMSSKSKSDGAQSHKNFFSMMVGILAEDSLHVHQLFDRELVKHVVIIIFLKTRVPLNLQAISGQIHGKPGSFKSSTTY